MPEATVLANDANDPDAADALAQQVAHLGTLDGLWLNAGYGAVAAVDDIDADFFNKVMHTNVRGPVLLLARLAQYLNDGAAVVLTSSTATYEGSPIASVYAATKAALIAIARNWAAALAPRRVRVNIIVPGAIGTDFTPL